MRLISSFFVAACIATGCSLPTSETITVTIKDVQIRARTAETVEEQQQGLAGVTQLGEDEGMLFVFPDSHVRTFWMRGMYIPIDILWIQNARVVGITPNVQAPYNSIEAQLPRLPSTGPVDRVLEVNAGFSEKHGITVGDAVTY
jgi:uncharacterized protein